MGTTTPVFWHRAVNLTHRKVALASFLRTAQDTQSHIYYWAHDPAALVIAEVAAFVGVVAMAWDLWESAAVPDFASPWVLIRSHAPDDGGVAEWRIPPHAVLCLDPQFLETGPPTLPRHHEWFVTGTAW